MQSYFSESDAETWRSCSALAGIPADAQRPMKASALQMFARSDVARRVHSRRDEIEMTIENFHRPVDICLYLKYLDVKILDKHEQR
jgi:hypothetical protein